jgi:hypothetical protein
MNKIVAAIWSFLLAASYGAVLPVLVALLRRALAAARSIERYSAKILAHSQGIARNTAHIVALEQTTALASELLAAGESLEQHTAHLKATLANNSRH